MAQPGNPENRIHLLAAARHDVAPGIVARTDKPAVAFGGLQNSSLLDDIPTPLVESLRYLIGRFQLGDQSDFPSRLAVTSALHGEGVTTISHALAAIVAHDLDVRVCWVDLSWPIPRRNAEPQVAPGIAELFMGKLELSEALQTTEDPRLTVLHAGNVPPAQRETFARSPLLATMLDQVARQFPCVILDAPPVLAGSAGLGQLRHANSYLLVVRHGVTPAPQVRAACDELKSIPSLGVVLNQFKSSIPKRLIHFFVS
jgi:Mrp family chromosome partitioning ATPase